MASLANKDEAEKCRDMAKKFLGRGESEKAVRFFEKSLKLYPLPGVEAMRDIAKQGEQDKGTAGQRTSAPPGRTTPSERSQQRSAPFSATNGNANSSRSNGEGEGGGRGGEGTGSSPGVRRRPASVPSSGNSSSNGGGGGTFSEEQERAVKQVLDSKSKGHYAVLGVDKRSNEDQIKKAYRKLALRFHPDKNRHPKANEAFQAIGNAFAVLSDGDKRAHYDRYGEDDGPQGIGGGGGGGGFGRSPFGRHGHGADVSPEDIFNMFFGVPGGGGGVRRQGGGAGPFRVYRAGGGGARGAGNGAGAQGTNSVEKVTSQKRGVVEGINYYVAPKFRQQYASNRDQLRRVEITVTEQYKTHLRIHCRDLQDRRRSRVNQAKKLRRHVDSEAYNQLVHEAETMPLPACEELVDKFSSFSHYN